MPIYRAQSGQLLQIIVSRTGVLPADIAALGVPAARDRLGVFGWAQGITLNQTWAIEAPLVMGQMHPYDLVHTGWNGTGNINKLVVEGEKLVSSYGIPGKPVDDLVTYAKELLASENVVFSVINKLTEAIEREAVGRVNAETFTVNAGQLATGTAGLTLAKPF